MTKINGIDYEECKKCGTWQTYDASGNCERCGRRIIAKESTADMVAEWTQRGYITN